jgi:predicted dehydrogenase
MLPITEDFNTNALPWRVNPEIAGAGYFYDLACHQLDLFEWFFGPLKQVTGRKYNRGGLYAAEDTVFAAMEYGGLPVMASWCFVIQDQFQQDAIKVHGSNGTLEFSTFGFSTIKLKTQQGESGFLPPNPENIQYWYIRNMVQELQGIRPQAGNGESAARTNRIMDEILGKI